MRAIEEGESEVVRNVILPSMIMQNLNNPMYPSNQKKLVTKTMNKTNTEPNK
jgi:hypothetical protein